MTTDLGLGFGIALMGVRRVSMHAWDGVLQRGVCLSHEKSREGKEKGAVGGLNEREMLDGEVLTYVPTYQTVPTYLLAKYHKQTNKQTN